jgi:hypothetical protein
LLLDDDDLFEYRHDHQLSWGNVWRCCAFRAEGVWLLRDAPWLQFLAARHTAEVTAKSQRAVQSPHWLLTGQL